jgi:4-carboxymuconolactone decarboxylase
MTSGIAREPRLGQARIPLLALSDMTPQQRAFHDDVVAGPRGQMVGPLLAAIHSPDLATLWSQFGEFLRFKTCLPQSLNELAILVCARRWTSQVEWWVHARVALAAGLSDTVIDAIRQHEAPVFHDEAEFEIYEFARLLQQQGGVPMPLYRAVKKRWGTRGVVELTAVIGYYTLVAMTLIAHQIPVPDDIDEPLDRVESLLDLPGGRRDQEVPA